MWQKFAHVFPSPQSQIFWPHPCVPLITCFCRKRIERKLQKEKGEEKRKAIKKKGDFSIHFYQSLWEKIFFLFVIFKN